MKTTIPGTSIKEDNTIVISDISIPYSAETETKCDTYIGFLATSVKNIEIDYPEDFTSKAGGFFQILKLKKSGNQPKTYALHLNYDSFLYAQGEATARTYTFTVRVNTEDDTVYDETTFTLNQCGCQEPIKTYSINVVPNPNSSYGTTYGTGRYESGTTVQIGVTLAENCAFLQWKEGESTANPRTITVSGDATYNALLYRISDGTLRIVDNSLNLYTYSEYEALKNNNAAPAAIGVAVNDGIDWIVCYKSYIGNSGKMPLGKGETELDKSVFNSYLPNELLYPHSGLDGSLLFKQQWPSTSYAPSLASTLSDGGLTWWIPNLYELTQILSRGFDSEDGAKDGFDSHFSLAGCSILNKASAPNTMNNNAHWTTDVGTGMSATAGQYNPYRLYYLTNGKFSYMTSGKYTFKGNANYTRPVARIPAEDVIIEYKPNGATSGTVPEYSNGYKGDLFVIKGNTGNLSKTNAVFNGWNTLPEGSGTHYDIDSTTHLHSDMILYAEWVSGAVGL